MGSCMASASAETLAARMATRLGDMSLEVAEGDFLGPEEELLDRLRISRPTLRQASKMAENDGLIKVRRGVKGGLYAARPNAAGAIKVLVRYLRLRGARMRDVMGMSRPVAAEAAALAAECRDHDLRRELEAFLESIESRDTPGDLIRAEIELARIVAAMSGNPAIELVLSIGFSFGFQERDAALFGAPEHRARLRKLQRDLCRAILESDAEVARLMMQRRSAAIAVWLKESGLI
ncbi:MAG: FCD domain-containing protein [Rhizorhabdus sp.]